MGAEAQKNTCKKKLALHYQYHEKDMPGLTSFAQEKDEKHLEQNHPTLAQCQFADLL